MWSGYATLGQTRQPAPQQSRPTKTVTTEDGRKVILKPDGTWEYEPEATPKTVPSEAPGG